MTLRTLVIFILAISIHLLYAAPQAPLSFMERIRPTMERVLGIKYTEMIIGKAPEVTVDHSVTMPLIPAIIENAKSIEVYNKKEDSVALGRDIEEKYYLGYIKEVYQASRKESPNEDDIGKYFNVLSQGGTREGVYRALVLDNVYAGMENREGFAVKSSAADFAVFIYDKYFNKKIKKDQFKGWNIFTLKRIVTETALEVMDSFGEDRNGLEAWYANLSSDLAFKFQQTMQNNLRKNNSALVHKDWAQKVPVQHIKSEIIIKIHSAFNSLI